MRKFSWGSPNHSGRSLAAREHANNGSIAFALQALGFIFGLYVAYLCLLVLGTQP